MAELDPNVILAGVNTTHPVAALTPQAAAQDAATTQSTLAGTQLTNAQTTGLDLQNQLAQMNLQNNSIYAQAVSKVRATALQKAQTAAGVPQPPSTTGVAPITNAPGPQGSGVPASIAAPTDNTSSSTASSNPPGTVPVIPAGVDPSWKIDTARDWYTDANGTPISHYSGPTLSPSGRVNLHSADLQDQIADQMEKLGAQPQFTVAM